MKCRACLLLLSSILFAVPVAASLSDLYLVDERAVPKLPAGWQAGYVKEPIFNGRLFVVEAGQQHARTVILVHGLGQNGWRDWRPIMPVLAEQFHVIALDLPGFGYSDKSEGRYSPTQYARLLHWLQEQSGRERVSLVGHSMGGAVALRFASSFPDLLEQLVLVSVAGVLERTAFLHHRSEASVNFEDWPETVRQQAEYRWRRVSSKMLDLARRLPDPGELMSSDLVWNAILKGSPSGNAALALIGENFTGALASIDMPTLIIWGEDDPVAPLRTGRLLQAQIPHSELLTFEHVGHVPMTEAPGFNQIVKDFLSGQRPSQPPEAIQVSLVEAVEDLTCQGLHGVRYRGDYRTIRLINCRDIYLEGVRARQLEMMSSEVNLLNVTLASEGTALKAVGSVVKMTNGTVSGRVGVSAAHSRLDMAGVKIAGQQQAVSVKGGSQFVFSLSELHEPEGTRFVHGSYRLAAKD